MFRPLLAAAFLAACAAVFVAVLSGAWPYTALGNTDPGALVRIGAPALRLVADASATVTIGSLAFAASFTSSPTASCRTASRAATLWAVAAGALIPFDVADQTGQSLAGPSAGATSSVGMTTWQLFSTLETPIAWLVTAWLAVGIALASHTLTSRRTLIVVFGVALLTVLPALATGHASSNTGHDIATGALFVHVPLALLWLGVLIALTRARWQTGLPADEVVARYRRLAGWCWLGLAGSGLLVAAVLAPPTSWADPAYDALVLVKIVLMVALGLLGAAGRRALVRRAFVGRLAVAELVLLGATVGISVGLTHLPPPAFLGHAVSPQQTLLGYNLTVPPGLRSVLLGWRFEPVFACIAVVLAVLYLIAVRRVGRTWPVRRTVNWCLGCAVLLVATNSGIARYAGAMFSYEMASHMLVAMLAPILLALGSPANLAAAALGRESVGTSRAMTVLTHPLVAYGLFVTAPFLLYTTGLYDVAVRFHWAHLLIDAVFLGIGYLFALVTVGLDPVPRPLPSVARAGLLLAAMPGDVVFCAVLISGGTVLGNGVAAANFYSSLGLPWVPDLLADQRLGGLIALVVGEGSLVLALVALLCRWHRVDDTVEDETASELAVAVRAARSRT